MTGPASACYHTVAMDLPHKVHEMGSADMDEAEAAAPTGRALHWAFFLMGLFVCGAGALVGAVFGMVAARIYEGPDATARMMVGRALGGAGGLLAGVVWSWKMLPWVRHVRLASLGGGKLVNRGMVWGIYVGLGSTVLLHAGLMLVYSRLGAPGLILICLGVGAIAGQVTGLLCGVVALIVALATRPGPKP